jgi:hypothetical protein
MDKKIKDYLHFYLDCDCFLSFSEDGDPDKRFRLTYYNLNYYRQWLDDILPVLRPLSDMTYDERQECGNMIYDFSDDPELNDHQWQDFEIGLAPEQFHWLLSKNFDLFGLIESGLAIDATTLTSQVKEK